MYACVYGANVSIVFLDFFSFLFFFTVELEIIISRRFHRICVFFFFLFLDRGHRGLRYENTVTCKFKVFVEPAVESSWSI